MKILIAEDERVSRIVLERVLVSMGHEVVTTSNGQEAWERYSEEFFPVVITDWMMPEMDGIELARRIRRARYRQYTWMIMLTSLEFKQNHAYSIEAGIDDYLVKPLNRELLRVRLRVASRLCDMTDRVRLLEAGMPVCMGCKDVKQGINHWANIETYLSRHAGIDVTHAMCPDCHYRLSLLPELEQHARVVSLRRPSIAQARKSQEPLDSRWLTRLEAYAQEQAPGLLQEAVEDFITVMSRFYDEFRSCGPSWEFDPPAQARFALFRTRCNHIGAFRLGAMLAPRHLRPLQPTQPQAERDRLLAKIEQEMALILGALRNKGFLSTPQPSQTISQMA